MLTALLLGLFMIPVLPGAGAEVRGNGEMFPLNGPGWSLFFEYIGSIIYALKQIGRRAKEHAEHHQRLEAYYAPHNERAGGEAVRAHWRVIGIAEHETR